MSPKSKPQIIIDIGADLPSENRSELPPIDGVTSGASNCDAVFMTHYHGDHVGLCKANNITLNKLGTISGITQSTLNNIISGASDNPTVSTIQKVCDGLDMSIIDFFNHKIFENIEQEVE